MAPPALALLREALVRVDATQNLESVCNLMAAPKGEDSGKDMRQCCLHESRRPLCCNSVAPCAFPPLASHCSNERLGAAFLASFPLQEFQTSRGESRVARQAATSKMAEFTIFRVKKILNLSQQNWWLWKRNQLYLV